MVGRRRGSRERKAMFARMKGMTNRTYKKYLTPFADADKDGVKNIKDCKPFDPKKQDNRDTRIAKAKTLRRYMKSGDVNDYFRINEVPASVAKGTLVGYPAASPKDKQNYSPNMKKMVEIASKYNGTMIGYVIPVESGRDDSRVTYDGFMINATEKQARDLKQRYKPDEFDEYGKNEWRFWWD